MPVHLHRPRPHLQRTRVPRRILLVGAELVEVVVAGDVLERVLLLGGAERALRHVGERRLGRDRGVERTGEPAAERDAGAGRGGRLDELAPVEVERLGRDLGRGNLSACLDEHVGPRRLPTRQSLGPGVWPPQIRQRTGRSGVTRYTRPGLTDAQSGHAGGLEDDEALRLLTLVAHELRTPLTVTSGYLKMLASERLGPLTEGQRKGVAASIRAADQLLALAADLSDLAKIDRGDVTAVRSLVRASALLDATIALYADLPCPSLPCAQTGDDDPWVSVDRARVARALRTLVAVVARTLPESATLHLSRRRQDVDGEPWLAIVIAEAGAGPARLPESGPLAPIDEAQGGLGVGLPLARRILALHGGLYGALDPDPIDARAGGGTRAVLVLLPIAPDRPDAAGA